MRTTITLAADVSASVDRLRRERGVGVSEVVNDLLRRGLAAPEQRAPFRQRSSDMGQPLLPLDDVAGLIETLEGAQHR